MNILGFGDNIVDRFVDRGTDYPGGNCVNVAVYARRLGLEAAYLGVFGDDEPGVFLRESVAVSTLQVLNGGRTFVDYNGGITVREPFTMDDTALAYAASHSLVHSSVYSRTEDQLPALAAAGPLLSFDLSDEAAFRTPSYLDRVAPHLDLALLSCSDLPEPAVRDLLADVVRRGARIALATRGAHGAVVHDGRFLLTTPAVPADPHTLVDTMGCGDAFLAGFVVSLLRAGWSKDSPPARPALERALE